MPQMMPMMWLFLLFYSLILLMYIFLNIYYLNFKLNFYKKKLIKNKYFNLLW